MIEERIHSQIDRSSIGQGGNREADNGDGPIALTATLWSRLPTGEPVYSGVRAWIRAKVANRMEAGGSTIIAVHALETHIERDAAPGEDPGAIVYHNRTWHRLSEHSIIG